MNVSGLLNLSSRQIKLLEGTDSSNTHPEAGKRLNHSYNCEVVFHVSSATDRESDFGLKMPFSFKLTTCIVNGFRLLQTNRKTGVHVLKLSDRACHFLFMSVSL